MTTKEWLSRVRYTKERIVSLDAERQQMFELATSTTGNVSPNKVQSTYENTSNEIMTLYAGYSEEIDAQKISLFQIEKEIRGTISKVENTTLQTLLMLRYLEFKTWEQIAEVLNLSDYWVRTRLHSKALLEIEKIRGLDSL